MVPVGEWARWVGRHGPIFWIGGRDGGKAKWGGRRKKGCLVGLGLLGGAASLEIIIEMYIKEWRKDRTVHF